MKNIKQAKRIIIFMLIFSLIASLSVFVLNVSAADITKSTNISSEGKFLKKSMVMKFTSITGDNINLTVKSARCTIGQMGTYYNYAGHTVNNGKIENNAWNIWRNVSATVKFGSPDSDVDHTRTGTNKHSIVR